MNHIQDMDGSVIKEQVIGACRRMLGPIVRILLRNGVSWREFSELGKEVYVDIARRDYGVQGRPTNVARVAMMTGISRREVTRVRDVIEGQEGHKAEAPNRISAVLSAWHLDPEFLDGDGTPAVLPASGEAASLEALLSRYAGDLPHGAFTKELLQLGLITKADRGYEVLKRDYVRRASDPGLLRQAAVALEDHGTTLAFNADAERDDPPRFERMATSLRLDRRRVNDFHRFMEQKGQAFLEEVDAWLTQHSLPEDSRADNAVRAGLGMYLIQDDD